MEGESAMWEKWGKSVDSTSITCIIGETEAKSRQIILRQGYPQDSRAHRHIRSMSNPLL
jgi:hypothetical protein